MRFLTFTEIVVEARKDQAEGLEKSMNSSSREDGLQAGCPKLTCGGHQEGSNVPGSGRHFNFTLES